MNDNALYAILISAIAAGLEAQSISVGIQQAYQPTQQGTPSTDTVFLTKLYDNRYGSPGRQDSWNAGTSVMTHTETEWLETKFQVEALAIQDPVNVTQTTAADYLKAVARTLQNEGTIANLLSQGVGIYRIQAFKQTYFMDDKDRFESSPMFEFTVTHQDTLALEIGSTDTIAATINVPNG